MKKLTLLVLALASAAAFMVPATASAELESLHMSPTPAKLDVAGVGSATLRSAAGNVTCNGVTGTATPEAGGTTGKLVLTFGPHCTGPTGETCTSNSPAHTNGSILTTELTYHLVTIDNVTPTAPSAGVLVTPNAVTGTFAHFNCLVFGFPVQTTVKGNGVLGTITAPACGASSTTATMSFKASGGTTTQLHRFTHNATSSKTTGPWSLTDNSGEAASQEAHATLTATNAAGAATNTELVCT